jgi:branched-chain amino acid transport system permease protein
MEIFGIPLQAFLGQLMLGLVNGAFYAMLSLGLAVIFGLLDIVNFAHGALYMLGAFAAWIMLDKFEINFWLALILAPLIVGVLGVVIERAFLKRLYGLDPLYGLLLTFGLSLIFEGIFRDQYGRTTGPSSSSRRSWCAWAPGSSSSARGWARTCVPAPRTPSSCRPSA